MYLVKKISLMHAKVDEGQDFRDLWWASMDSLFRDPGNKGCYYVCTSLIPSKMFLPFCVAFKCEPFNLPGKLSEYGEDCQTFRRDLIGIEPSVRDNAPLGDDPEIQSKDFNEGSFVAAKKVNEWCQAGKGFLKVPSQVADWLRGRKKLICFRISSVPFP